MEHYVKKQQANIADEEAQFAEEVAAQESNQKPESEKLLPNEQANIRSMADLCNAIKEGDEDVEKALLDLAEKMAQVCDGISDIQSRITNIETILESYQQSNVVVHEMSNRIAKIETVIESQQLTSVSMLNKLANIGSALVAFVAKFGTKKDEAQAKDEVEAEAKKE